MSLKEIKEAPKRIQLADLPQELEANCNNATWETDDYDRKCLIVEWKATADDSLFTQKYTPMHLNELEKRMVALKIDNLADQPLTLEKVSFRIGHDRMMPKV